MDNRKWLWIALGLIGVGVCAIVCIVAAAIGNSTLIIASQSVGSTLTVGSPAPDFELYTLDGDTVTLSQFRGSPVLLELGATWCPDCKDTAPKLQELHETYPGLVVLSVDSEEDASTVQDFADSYGLTILSRWIATEPSLTCTRSGPSRPCFSSTARASSRM